MDAKTIGQMTAEVREVNTALGWRAGRNTFGEHIALLHTEVAEALEAYRDHRLVDATGQPQEIWTDTNPPVLHGWKPAKPEGVGSELADVLIRLVDTGDLFGFSVGEPDTVLADVALGNTGTDVPHRLETFGDWVAWLHRCIDRLWETRDGTAMLRALVTVAARYGFNLAAEYERKIAYNRTRPYQHGGRTLSEVGA